MNNYCIDFVMRAGFKRFKYTPIWLDENEAFNVLTRYICYTYQSAPTFRYIIVRAKKCTP